MVNKKFLFIPHWIHEYCKQRQVHPAICADFSKCKKYLSLNDIAGIIRLNKDLPFFPEGYASYLFNGVTSTDPDDQNAYRVADAHSFAPEVSSDLYLRLFSPYSERGLYVEPFTINTLDDNVIVVVIYPGFFKANESLQYSYETTVPQNALPSALLKALYVYNQFSEVSTTTLFTKYLTGLRTESGEM